MRCWWIFWSITTCSAAGLGKALVAYAVRSLEADGIWAVQAVFDPTLEPFYGACGFAMCQAGLVRTAAAGRGPARGDEAPRVDAS